MGGAAQLLVGRVQLTADLFEGEWRWAFGLEELEEDELVGRRRDLELPLLDCVDEPFAGLFTQGMVVHETYKSKNGDWVEPANVTIEGMGDTRRAKLTATGEALEIGSIEKMSKSKKNVVDPDDIIAAYGADTARWFMLSDSPPDRDVIWTDEGVQGAARFVQRLWRMVAEIAERTGGKAGKPAEIGEAALALRKASHRALDAVGADIERLGFLQYLRKLKRFVCLRINDARIETKGTLRASDKATFRLRVTTREQGYLMAASDKLVREIGHDPFGPTISKRRNRFSKR